MTLEEQSLTGSNIKWLPLIDCSRPIWYLSRKSFFIVFFCVSKAVIISMLSLSKCIGLFSVQLVVDKKLIFMARWIFHLPNFLKPFILSCRFDLIFSKYYSIISCSSPLIIMKNTTCNLFWFVVFKYVVIYFYLEKLHEKQHCLWTFLQTQE